MKRSRILGEVHEIANAMRRSGAIDKRTMREFDALLVPRVRDPSTKQIRALRLRVAKPRTTAQDAIAPIPRRDLEAFAEIYTRVAEFFRNTSKTTIWFRAPNPMLGGVRPIEMLLSGRAHRLLQFVRESDAGDHPSIPRKLSRAWMREIDRRVAGVDSSAVQTIPWAKARARLRRRSKTLAGR